MLYWLDGLELPDSDGLLGEPVIENFDSKQRYQIALCGEKTSLRAVLEPIAEKYGCHVYLGKGDFSEWLIYDLAVVAAADGRELIVLYFSDSDISGWNMPIVVSRKLSALRHNDLEVLCNSDWDFAEQTRALIESKKYAGMSSEFDESGDG